MTEQQRETVARAIYQAYARWHTSKRPTAPFTPWESLTEQTREMYRFIAEATIAAYKRM